MDLAGRHLHTGDAAGRPATQVRRGVAGGVTGAGRALSEVVMRRARANAVLVAAVTAAVLAGLVGCGRVGAEANEAALAAAAARAVGEAEKARLAARLEALEARLLEGRARVRAWRELRDRRERVAAEADGNAAWRVSDVLQAREAEQVLVRAIRAPRLAAAWVADPGTRAP